MSRNVFNNETETGLGQRLLNIQNLTLSQDKVPILSIDNVVEGVNISSYGRTLLNQTSVSSLRSSILEADSSIQIVDNGIGEINMEIDNNLKIQITDANTKINNNLLVDTIKRKTDDTNALSFGSTTMTLQKAMTIFRDSTNFGYMRIQNSTTNKTGYIDFMTGENERVAYFGQGEENDLLKSGNFLYLGLEGQCGYSINDGATPIFQVNLEYDKIDLNYTTNANGNLIMKNDNAHKQINNNNNLPFLKVPTGLNYSANLYGEDDNNGLILSKTALHYKLDAKIAGIDKDVYIPKLQCDTLKANTSAIIPTINLTRLRFTGETTDAILFSSNQTRYYKPIYIDWNSGQGKKFTIQGGNCDYSLYTSSIFGGAINISHNITYDPVPETESVTTDTLYTSKIIVSNEGIKFRQSASVNTLPTTDIASFSNTSCDFNNDIDLVGTTKLNFNSNNYLQNDGNNHLNMVLANDKNFIADTSNDLSSYEYKIDGNSVLKMTRDMTSNPVSNITQISSQSLLIKDESVSGGYISIERTGVSSVYSGYINYYNSSGGRIFYTGFGTGSVGTPICYLEDICRSYTYKNSLGNIMSIVSHSGTLSANSSYVSINKLECPIINSLNINMYNSNYVDGTTPNNDDGFNELTGRNSATSDVGHLRLSAGGGTAPTTSKTLIDIFGSDTEANRKILFRVGDQPMLKITSTEIRFRNAIVPDGGLINVGKINNRWANVYTTNVNSNTGLFNTNLQTPSLISSSNTTTYQSRLDMDDLLATFVCRDGTGVEKSILIGSYSALVANVQITANQGILMNNTFNSRDVVPTGDNLYDLGSLSQRYKDIYASNNVIQTSDKNLKTEINDIQNGLQTIMGLKPVSYKFIDGNSGRIHTGYIAQDCKDIYVKDWAGYIENDGRYGLRYTEFISLNTAAIQELYKIVENKNNIVMPKSNNDDTEQLRVDIEEIIQEKEEFKIELNKTKTQNYILEERVNQLENKLKIIENKTEDVEESDGGINMIELLQTRIYELELKNTKNDAKLKKLMSVVNRLVKK